MTIAKKTAAIIAGALLAVGLAGCSAADVASENISLADITGDEDTSMRDEIVSLWGTERPALVFGRWSVAAPVGEKQRLIWHKAATQGMGDLSMPWGPNFEDIHVLGGGWDREATGMPRTGAVITTTQAVGGGRRSGEHHRAPYAQAGWAHGTAHREVSAGHDWRPIRGIRRHAHSRPESRPPLYRRGNRGALLRGHRTAPLRAGHGPLGRR